jgi:hypothetical protein
MFLGEDGDNGRILTESEMGRMNSFDSVVERSEGDLVEGDRAREGLA